LPDGNFWYLTVSHPSPSPVAKSPRIAAIDWMRGFVMVLMIFDHASMSFDRDHLDEDSALFANASTMALPAGEFFTRWMTHLCAPTFIFLAGTALALSVERRVAKGEGAWAIDRNILTRGAIIALLDPTVISLGLGRLSFAVLFAIGACMMAMSVLRRLPTWGLLTFGVGWYVLGEWITGQVWSPPGQAPLAAFFVAPAGTESFSVKYALVPWLAVMALGWVFGRHMTEYASGKSRVSPGRTMLASGLAALAVFAVVRGLNGYGNMFLPRTDNSWQQWLHVSKYPPSLSYMALELGLMAVILAALLKLEPVIGVRENGVLLVFGQTAMFFYLVHRVVFDAAAAYGGLMGFGTLSTTYAVGTAMLVLLYPLCRWFRSLKTARPESVLRYV
jgi:uncharacterized membrane protein